MIGIAFTGSGKTLAFCLPLIMLALEDESKLPFVRGEGPVGVILCPSRELASQTYENVVQWAEALSNSGSYPRLNTLLCMGGISMSEQSHVLSKGIHIVVATPGRLIDMLEKRKLNFDCCKFFCMDEADRMVDLGFEDDVRNIMSFFKVMIVLRLLMDSDSDVRPQSQRQTLLFSATMPRKIQDFAQQSLIRPVLVNVGRAGAANLDVLQVVEYVKQEAKMVYLLECLQKTAPPVIVFSDNKNEVDDIQEYLLLKGVEAVAIHGSKSMFSRLSRARDTVADCRLSPGGTTVCHQILQVRRQGRHGRLGCRVQGSRFQRHPARHHLFHAKGDRGLRAPNRAHGTQRQDWHRDDIRQYEHVGADASRSEILAHGSRTEVRINWPRTLSDRKT